jgi:hypothetical protein
MEEKQIKRALNVKGQRYADFPEIKIDKNKVIKWIITNDGHKKYSNTPEFKYPSQAIRYIIKRMNNSIHLQIKKIKRVNEKQMDLNQYIN